MSKAALKKELNSFTGPELVELILNIYDSSKDAKEYLEFFLNPDILKLNDKFVNLIAKEISRTRRGMCKARISEIRNCIKRYAAMGVGAQYTGQLMYQTLQMLVGQERYFYYTDTLRNGTLKLMADFIKLANDGGFLSAAIDDIREMCNRSGFSTASFKSAVMIAMENTLEELEQHI